MIMSYEVRLNPKLKLTERQALEGLAAEFQQDNHIWVASSGSTQSLGDSLKLMALGREALELSAAAVNQHLQVTGRDRWFQVLPSFHVGGLAIELRAAQAGIAVVSALRPAANDFAGRWDPEHFSEVCFREELTLGSLVPTQIFDLVKKGLSAPRSLRAIVVGGGALSAKLYHQARSLGWPVLPSFGMTEACSQIATASLTSLENSGHGEFYPELEVLTHVKVRCNQEGELSLLELCGRSLLTGYAQYKDGKAIWIDPKDAAGWLLTQDVVELKGRVLRPLGRKGDYYKILGEGVSLLRLQLLLETILSEQRVEISSATILILPDERRGGRVILVTEVGLGLALSRQLRDIFNQRVERFEKIHASAQVLRIPRTELNKVKFLELAPLIVDDQLKI